MKSRGVTLRQLCRAVELDPSFFSKVLSGKRSPPMEEAVLRRIAAELGLDAAELVVAAGRIPQEWRGVWSDAELFSRVHRLASGGAPAASAPRPAPAVVHRPSAPHPSEAKERPLGQRHAPLSEELL